MSLSTVLLSASLASCITMMEPPPQPTRLIFDYCKVVLIEIIESVATSSNDLKSGRKRQFIVVRFESVIVESLY